MIAPPAISDPTLAKEFADHLFEHILPFWCGPAVDHQGGGWMAWLSNDLKADRSKPKGLIVHARILWTFSAVHQIRSDPLYRQMAERALGYLVNRFWDGPHGGAFWQLDDSGLVLEDSKKTYGQAFCIYALSEFHRAFAVSPALERAMRLFELIERHAHDSSHGGYVEVCARDWSEADPDARLSEKDLNEKKSMNNHLHVLEAYTSLFRETRHSLVRQRLHELIELFLSRILDSATNHLHHFFNERWQVRSESYTFGHDIEASWLLCEAAEVLGDPVLLDRVRPVALKMAETVLLQGIQPDGALVYEGRGGNVIDAGRECWPQAEAIVGFLNAAQLGGRHDYVGTARRVWEYANRCLVDRVHGEWFWRIQPDGNVDATLPKVSEWKGPYHVSRACLEAIRRLS